MAGEKTCNERLLAWHGTSEQSAGPTEIAFLVNGQLSLLSRSLAFLGLRWLKIQPDRRREIDPVGLTVDLVNSDPAPISDQCKGPGPEGTGHAHFKNSTTG